MLDTLLALAILLASCLISEARFFLALMPNGDRIPCINSEAGCHGLDICESFGHFDCAPTRPLNEYGFLYLKDPTGLWNNIKCGADSDFDGFTNGDELGDPCCEWNFGQQPRFIDDLSSPVHASSMPLARASCSAAASLSPPALQTVWRRANDAAAGYPVSATGSIVTVSWMAPPTSRTHCACQHSLALSAPASGSSNPATTAAAIALPAASGGGLQVFHVCESDPTHPFTAAVAAANRAGVGAWGVNLTLPVGAASVSAASVTPASMPLFTGCSQGLASPLIDSAGTPRYSVAAPAAGLGPATALWSLGAAVALAALCLARDPLSALRASLLHSPCGRLHAVTDAAACCARGRSYKPGTPAPTAPTPLEGGAASALDRLWVWLTWDVTTSSRGYAAAFVLCLAGLAACFASAYTWFASESYAYGQSGAVHRAAGFALTICLGLLLLPVTRFSVWLHLLGVPFERALRLHRWLGGVAVILTLWHGIGQAVVTARSQLGLKYLVLWSDLDAINPLPGLLAGLCILTIAAASSEPVRRRCYEAVVVAHLLWPAVIGLVIAHTWGCYSPPAPLLLPPAALLLLDFAVMAGDLWLRPVRVLATGVLSDRPYVEGWHRTVYVVASKRGRWHWVDVLWPFTFIPGQWVYIAVPQVSLFPHPYSISSPCDPALPGRFTVHIKCIAPGQWSHSVLKTLLEPRSFPATGAAVAETKLQHLPNGVVVNPLRAALATRLDVQQQQQQPETPLTAPAASAFDALIAGSSVPIGIPESNTPHPHWHAHTVGRAFQLLSNPSFPQKQSQSQLRQPFGAGATGPFGRCSLQLQNYQHFVLVAGGVGITAIAPLHYSLIRGLPVGHSAWASWAAQLWQHVASASTAAAAVSSGGGGVRARVRAFMAALRSGSRGGGGIARRPRLLTTIWTTRDRSLISAFSHMLDPGPELRVQQQDSAAVPLDSARSLALPLSAVRPPASAILQPQQIVINPLSIAASLSASAAAGEAGMAITTLSEADSAFRGGLHGVNAPRLLGDPLSLPTTAIAPSATPRANVITKGERMAQARQWVSSFAIHAKTTFGQEELEEAAAGEDMAPLPAPVLRGAESWRSQHDSTHSQQTAIMPTVRGGVMAVDLRVHLTSGRKTVKPQVVTVATPPGIGTTAIFPQATIGPSGLAGPPVSGVSVPVLPVLPDVRVAVNSGARRQGLVLTLEPISEAEQLTEGIEDAVHLTPAVALPLLPATRVRSRSGAVLAAATAIECPLATSGSVIVAGNNLVVSTASAVSELPVSPRSATSSSSSSIGLAPRAALSGWTAGSARPRSLARGGLSARALLAAIIDGPAAPPDAIADAAAAAAASGPLPVVSTAATCASGSIPVPGEDASLPVVNRLRPDIPKLLGEIASELVAQRVASVPPPPAVVCYGCCSVRTRRSGSADASVSLKHPRPLHSPSSSASQQLRLQQRSYTCCSGCISIAQDSVLGRFWALLCLVASVLLGWIAGAACCRCQRFSCCKRGLMVVRAPSSLPHPSSVIDTSSGMDCDGRIAIAVVVCGPHEMVLSTLDACAALNASSAAKGCGGASGSRGFVFHVHSETFFF